MNRKSINKKISQRIHQIAQENSDFTAMQLQRFVAMARLNLPAFKAGEIEKIVTSLGGVNLRPLDQMPWDELPFRLARRISDSKLSAHIADFEPFEAYLLLVCAELASINRLQLPNDIKDDAFFPLKGRDQK
jgi:hypothetical protein